MQNHFLKNRPGTLGDPTAKRQVSRYSSSHPEDQEQKDAAGDFGNWRQFDFLVLVVKDFTFKLFI